MVRELRRPGRVSLAGRDLVRSRLQNRRRPAGARHGHEDERLPDGRPESGVQAVVADQQLVRCAAGDVGDGAVPRATACPPSASAAATTAESTRSADSSRARVPWVARRSSCPRARSWRGARSRLFQRAIGASRRRNVLDDGLAFVTAPADPPSSPWPRSSCWNRATSAAFTGSELAARRRVAEVRADRGDAAPLQLGRDEEQQTIANDRPAEREADLLLLVSCLANERHVGTEALARAVAEHAAVQLVGAAPRHHVDARAGEAAVPHVEGREQDLDTLSRRPAE